MTFLASSSTRSYVNMYVCMPVGWLRLVGSIKLQVSFAEYRLFYRALLQKRPIILRSLLIVATPYVRVYIYVSSSRVTFTPLVSISTRSCVYIYIYVVCMHVYMYIYKGDASGLYVHKVLCINMYICMYVCAVQIYICCL